MAQQHSPEEMVVHRKQVIMRKEPIFFSVPLAGSEPANVAIHHNTEAVATAPGQPGGQLHVLALFAGSEPAQCSGTLRHR